VERSETSRSQIERIRNKMVRSTSVREGNTKRVLRGLRVREREYSETILLLFARAGSLSYISFFLLIIGFKG
jgi:hypothetical protein